MVEIVPRFFRVNERPGAPRVLSRIDWSLLAAVMALATFGVLFIFSATAHTGGASGFLARQTLGIVIGFLAMVFLALLPYQVFQTYARGVYVAGVVVLIATLVFGTRLRGSRSWIDLGPVYFQPVEVVRLFLAASLAAYADRRYREVRQWTGALPVLVLAGIYFGLILLQPDLSSALIMGPMTLAVLFSAGAPLGFLIAIVACAAIALGIPLTGTYFSIVGERWADNAAVTWIAQSFQKTRPMLILSSVAVAAAAAGWWLLRKLRFNVTGFHLFAVLVVLIAGVGGSFVVDRALKPYQRKRLIAFVDPAVDPLGAGYNILQSEIALGSGRFVGKGYLSGSQTQLGFLPEKHTDFIFSHVGEETGFLGALFVLTVFFWVAWRAFDIAFAARDRFGRHLAVALGTFFTFSGLINIGMAMGLMPVTGVPLPFLSYGGSGLVGSFMAVGLLLSIHLRRYLL